MKASTKWRPMVAAAVLTLPFAGSLVSGSRGAEPVVGAGDLDDWPTFGRTPGEQHYSPLSAVDLVTIPRLKPAWHYDLPAENTLTGPVEAEGKLFITTGHSYIRALDATSGELLWEYDSKTRKPGLNLRLGWGPKGLAYWNNRIFIGTQDGRVIALDAGSGKVLWQQAEYDPDKELRYINGPPRVFDGKVIVGHGGADVSAIRGYVTAYDAVTGKRAWRFYTVPGDPAVDHDETTKLTAKTWKGQWWNEGGGGTAWNAFSYDPDLKLLYIGVGNGFPYNQTIRSPGGGDNLYLASVVAVNIETGGYAWHYQVCPGEQWDCTAVQDMTLATVKIGGRDRKVLMQAPKNGFFYVLDRKTGELLSAEPYADKITWASRVDIATGRPVENPGIRYNGKPGLFEMWPGPRGAHSWLPQAYSPQTGLVYIPEIEGGGFIGDQGVDFKHMPKIGGQGVIAVPDPKLPGAWRSFLKAWDPVTQSARWSVPLPGNWPGGVMTTAGGLVFEGRMDGHLAAYDARMGKEVWSYATASPVVAPPISYSVGGRQYIAVLTGSGASGGGIFSSGNAAYRTDYRQPRQVITFALDGTDHLPPVEPAKPPTPPYDPIYRQDTAVEKRGQLAYAMSGCMVCHGWNAVGGGSAPDLRTSPYPASKVGFHAVLHDGALISAGMPGFSELSDDQIEAIRQYLRARGHTLGHAEGAADTPASSGRTG